MLSQTEQFKELVDRSLMILVLRCEKCGAILAKIKYPQTAKLDSSCDELDHLKQTGHSSYMALKILIVYMCQADKELADQLGEAQRKAFDRFMDTFKKDT